jgi:proteasome accessory factor C
MLPWLMERDQVPVREMAERFDVSEQNLIADLEVASMCGLPPYVDEMVDLYIEDGIIHVGIPRLFTRPLRLTPQEGFTVLAAGRAALQLPGADPGGPLGRALTKLADALGAHQRVVVEMDRPQFLAAVQQAAAAGERLAVTYYSAHRDELTERTIDPQVVFGDRGHWYVVADDSATGGERRFRVDRIESCRPTGEHFAHREVPVPRDGWFDEGTPVVTLRLPVSAAWVAETYPVRAVTRDGDDLTVQVPVVGERWLERLLLRVGPEAAVLDPPELAGVGQRAAARLLARYR